MSWAEAHTMEAEAGQDGATQPGCRKGPDALRKQNRAASILVTKARRFDVDILRMQGAAPRYSSGRADLVEGFYSTTPMSTGGRPVGLARNSYRSWGFSVFRLLAWARASAAPTISRTFLSSAA